MKRETQGSDVTTAGGGEANVFTVLFDSHFSVHKPFPYGMISNHINRFQETTLPAALKTIKAAHRLDIISNPCSNIIDLKR